MFNRIENPLSGRLQMERSVLAAGLREVDPEQPYGRELFDALSLLTTTVTVEAACLRRVAGSRVEVYLIQKPPAPAEPWYPELWCMPGTIVRPRKGDDEAFARLEAGKFGGRFGPAKDFAGVFDNLTEPRGHMLCKVYLCTLEQEGAGRWWPVDELPPMIWYHRDGVLPLALKKF